MGNDTIVADSCEMADYSIFKIVLSPNKATVYYLGVQLTIICYLFSGPWTN